MSFKLNAQALAAIDNLVIKDATLARSKAEQAQAVESALSVLRPLIVGKTQDEVRDAVIAKYAAVCGFETIIVAKGTHAGRVGWPEGAAAQKKACARFLDKLFDGECVEQAKPKQGQYETPAELLQAALALVKLAAEYGEDLQKVLASQAVADAWVALKKA